MELSVIYAKNHGVPKGSRTPVASVKGRCPRPLDDGDLRIFTTALQRSVFYYMLLKFLSNFAKFFTQYCSVLVEVSGIEPLTP